MDAELRTAVASARSAWPCAALCVLMAAAGARAEGNPYSIGASLAISKDNNLFRSPPGEAVSDRYVTASLFGGVDQSIGRQRVQASAAVYGSRYHERADLDNTGYSLRLGWNGATAGEVSWDLSYAANRALASYATVVDPALRVANLESSRQAIASAQLGLQAQWLANVTLSHRNISYSAPSYAAEEVRLDALGLGVSWNPQGPLSLSFGPRHTRGRYPHSRGASADTVEATGFVRDDLDLGANWVASGASTLTTRFSLTRQRDDVLHERDFDGATAQLRWQWAVTGKTRVDAALSRDTGSETSFLAQSTPGDVARGSGDNSRLTNSVSMRVDYDLTGKIMLSAGGSYARRQLSANTLMDSGGGVLVPVSLSGNERSGSLNLGLRYAPTRNSLLGCGLGYARRGSSTSLSSPYRANTASCSAQLTLQ
jgi:Putative beta-barrel porin 2